MVNKFTMKKYIFTLLALASLIGCEQEEIGAPDTNKDAPVFSANVEGLGTKTSLDADNYVIWNTDDKVSIFAKNSNNQEYIVEEGTAGSTSCNLVTNSDKLPQGGSPLNQYIGVYPYGKNTTITGNGNRYTISNVSFPSEQSYTAESFASGSYPMVAVSNNTTLPFKNVGGSIMIQVTGNINVASVSIAGNSGEKLSGAATVTAASDATPSITMANEAKQTVTLNCGGVQLNQEKITEFIVSVPPTEFKAGFKVIVKDTENKEYVIETSKVNKVERSSILVMPEVSLTKEEDTPAGGAVTIQHEGLQYVWDESVIPEITINVTKDEWNRLLAAYDSNPSTKEYIKCDISYKKGSEITEIIDAGIRLRGNTSRRRPEVGSTTHRTNNADWQHCHFGVNLRKFNKNNDNIKVKDVKGIRKFNLKWFKDDACYVREVFCYDLFRRAGIWTAAHDVYCRLWIHVEGDSKPAYYGVYEMIEPYDNKYLEKREHLFGTSDGHLWKCSYDSHGPADLSNPNANMAEDNDRDDFTYELKEYGDHSNFETAKAQLQDFMLKLNGKAHGTPGDSFYKWIKEVCDVDLLMRTYAVNVAVGMWDDLWNNGNNYYLYFTTSDKYAYKVYFIPYDYDNSLGTSNANDAAKQDPYKWGSKGVLMNRMMEYEEFRKIYRDELKRLVDPANGLMDTESSIARIKAWQAKIKDYISNDTGEDMKIEDKPASWGHWGDYNLMDYNNNYFTVKAETINNLR